ncbi:MAG: low molecular weight protein arginine phosphatase [Anaerotignaceae bacterium]
MNILFVCTGNTCRSPMAEAVAKSIFPKDEYNIMSAGLSVIENQSASENAVLAAENLGLDLKGHRAKQITPNLIKEADIVLTMTAGHKQAIANNCNSMATPVFTLAEYAGHGNEDVMDPYGCDLEIYEKCILKLKQYIVETADIITK